MKVDWEGNICIAKQTLWNMLGVCMSTVLAFLFFCRNRNKKAHKVDKAILAHPIDNSQDIESRYSEDDCLQRAYIEEPRVDAPSHTRRDVRGSTEDGNATTSTLPRGGMSPKREYGSVDMRLDWPGKKEITDISRSRAQTPQTYVTHVAGEPHPECAGNEERSGHNKTVDKLGEDSKDRSRPVSKKGIASADEPQAQAPQTRLPQLPAEPNREIAEGGTRIEHRSDDKSVEDRKDETHLDPSKGESPDVKERQSRAPHTDVPQVPGEPRGEGLGGENQSGPSSGDGPADELGEGSKASEVTADRSFIYEDETARRFFLATADAYSEKETMSWTESLNARIGSLSAHLISRIHGQIKTGKSSRRSNSRSWRVGQSHDSNSRVPQLVKRALGVHLLGELLEVGNNGKENEDNDATIQDALDAWSVFCVHLAVQPMLFGLRLRSVEEVEEVLRHIADHEPELARFWNRIRTEVPWRDIDPQIRSSVEDISPLREPRLEDLEAYARHEQTYRKDFAEAKHQQIALHWRAMLHKHELSLSSYKSAIMETEEVLLQGLLHVFKLARVGLPATSHSLRTMIEKVVKDAATLAERTRTSIFSQSIEVVVIEAGCAFDKENMRSADGDAGEVKCTIQLGLKAIDSDGKPSLLLLPEVLLV